METNRERGHTPTTKQASRKKKELNEREEGMEGFFEGGQMLNI